MLFIFVYRYNTSYQMFSGSTVSEVKLHSTWLIYEQDRIVGPGRSSLNI